MNIIPSRGGNSKSQIVNLYAHLHYRVLHELDITIPEYWYLDMVYQLSRDGWCYKSLQSIANDMKMSKRGVAVMRDRLKNQKLIKTGINGRVKTDVAYNSVIRQHTQAYNSVPGGWNSVPHRVELSATKNNKRITKEYKATKKESGSGYQKAKAMRDSLAGKLSLGST